MGAHLDLGEVRYASRELAAAKRSALPRAFAAWSLTRENYKTISVA